MHISVYGVLRTLAAPDWQNNLAQHTGSDHAYIARRDQNYVAIAGQFDETLGRSFGKSGTERAGVYLTL